MALGSPRTDTQGKMLVEWAVKSRLRLNQGSVQKVGHQSGFIMDLTLTIRSSIKLFNPCQLCLSLSLFTSHILSLLGGALRYAVSTSRLICIGPSTNMTPVHCLFSLLTLQATYVRNSGSFPYVFLLVLNISIQSVNIEVSIDIYIISITLDSSRERDTSKLHFHIFCISRS